MRIAALATGMGNVRNVVRALEHATSARRAEVVLTSEPDVLRRADVLVAPGQGAFGPFAAALDAGGLREVLLERIAAGTPFLGICLGLQGLFETSDEAEGARGLGVLRGKVIRLAPGLDPETGRPYPLPHIGWNVVKGTDVVAEAHYYFAHSYAAVPTDRSIVIAEATYGEPFVAAVRKDNVVGIQFHPEKSQRAGLAVLERFFGEL